MSTVIDVEHLDKVYPRGIRALQDVTCSLRAGGSIGLIGPNGAGKTTLIKALLGLLAPTSGTVQVLGTNAGQLSTDQRKRIGFLFDDRGLYADLTVQENLIFWTRLYGGREEHIPELLRQWELWDARNNLERTLSAGMKEKLGIVRSILHDPELLILDEPTSNLDPLARRQVVDQLRMLVEAGRTLLVTSHDLFDIERLCPRIMLLRKGSILIDGTMDDLRHHLGVGHMITITLASSAGKDVQQQLAERFGAVFEDDLHAKIDGDKVHAGDMVTALVAAGAQVERVEEQKVSLEDLYAIIIKEDEQR